MFNAVPLLLVLFGKHTICQLSFHPKLLFFKQIHPTHHLSMGATSPIFCFSGSFSEMNVRAVRVQFSKIFFFWVHEPACTRSQLKVRQIPSCRVDVSGWCAPVVRNPVISIEIFFLSHQILARCHFHSQILARFGDSRHHSRLWRTHAILAQELKFCGNAVAR